MLKNKVIKRAVDGPVVDDLGEWDKTMSEVLRVLDMEHVAEFSLAWGGVWREVDSQVRRVG